MGDAEHSSVRRAGGVERFKPARKRNECGGRLSSRCVQLRHHGANYAAGLSVLPILNHIRKRGALFGALHQNRVTRVCKHARGTVAIPPPHYMAATPLLLLYGYLEHSAGVSRAHWQQYARRGGDRVAVRREAPPFEVLAKHRSEITKRARVRNTHEQICEGGHFCLGSRAVFARGSAGR